MLFLSLSEHYLSLRQHRAVFSKADATGFKEQMQTAVANDCTRRYATRIL
jgi:hypothetical protein